MDDPALPIYLTADLSLWCVVSPEDYAYLVQWLWNAKKRAALAGTHFYAKRNEGSARTPVYLHLVVLRRKEPMPARRRIGDHISGNTLDCRRSNLRWVTPRRNARNKGGRSFLIEPSIPSLDIPF